MINPRVSSSSFLRASTASGGTEEGRPGLFLSSKWVGKINCIFIIQLYTRLPNTDGWPDSEKKYTQDLRIDIICRVRCGAPDSIHSCRAVNLRNIKWFKTYSLTIQNVAVLQIYLAQSSSDDCSQIGEGFEPPPDFSQIGRGSKPPPDFFTKCAPVMYSQSKIQNPESTIN